MGELLPHKLGSIAPSVTPVGSVPSRHPHRPFGLDVQKNRSPEFLRTFHSSNNYMVKCRLTSCIYSVLRINDLSFSLCFPAGQQISPKPCFNKCKKYDTQSMQSVCIEIRFLSFFPFI